MPNLPKIRTRPNPTRPDPCPTLIILAHLALFGRYKQLLMLHAEVRLIAGQQRYMILHDDKLYVYKDETATRAQKLLIVSNFCR